MCIDKTGSNTLWWLETKKNTSVNNLSKFIIEQDVQMDEKAQRFAV